MKKTYKVNLIVKNSNRGYLDGPLKILNKLYQEFEVRHPNWFQIMKYQRGNNKWDGKIHFISERGEFELGLLQTIYNRLINMGCKVKVIDQRNIPIIQPVVLKEINGYTLREAQINAVKALINNKLGNYPHYIGVQDMSVGSGKSLTMAAIHLAFKRKYNTLILLNDSDLFNQFKKEFPAYLGKGIPITFIQGSKVNKWSEFNIGMVQSICRNIKTYQRQLANIDIVLVDEADQATSKTYQTVIRHLYNTKVRVGLSGTIYMSKLKKDLLKNMNTRKFFGDILSTVTISDMVKKGQSTPVVVKMVPSLQNALCYDDYMEEYNASIICKHSFKVSLERTVWNIKQGRLPALIVTKYIDHCEKLYKFYKRRLEDKYIIKYVHHKTKERDNILKEFRDGKIDILISTTIISRGKNFPLLKYLQNCASMDSNEKSIQILGRLVRTHESKKKAYLDDICYMGHYLTRHGNHRKRYYISQKLKVIDLRKFKRQVKYPKC